MGASTYQACKVDLETQEKVDVAVLTLTFVGHVVWLETWADFLCYSLRVEFLLLWETCFLFIRPPTDGMRPTQLTECNPLYLKSIDCKC